MADDDVDGCGGGRLDDVNGTSECDADACNAADNDVDGSEGLPHCFGFGGAATLLTAGCFSSSSLSPKLTISTREGSPVGVDFFG